MGIRVVVLGNSYASYCQIPALRFAGGADVVAVCGKDLKKAQATAARFAIPLATTSLAEALAERPDLVIVSTPVDLHAHMVEQALATTSAAVLCEKPFTLDVGVARALAEKARGRLALVDHQLRWSAPRRRFKELVAQVGTPWVARSEMCFGSVERMTRPHSWWDDVTRGGGAMQAIGSHLVDGLLWMLGPVVDVQRRLTTCVQQRTVGDGANAVLAPVTADDHGELWLTHASGARSSMLCSVVHVHGRRSLLELIGSRGTLRLVDEQELYFGTHDGALKRVDVTLASVAEVEACNDSAFARSEPLFLRDVVRAVARGDTWLPHAATFDDAVANVQILNGG